jgi:hypothetical protein
MLFLFRLEQPVGKPGLMDHLPEAIARMGKVKTGVRRGLPGLMPQNTTRRPGQNIVNHLYSRSIHQGKYKGLIMHCL